MLITINPSDDVALHEQIAAAVRGAIAEGRVVAGERLPTARDLGASLEVNMHTVLRAYRALQDEGLVEVRRGRGVTVLKAAAGRASTVQAAQALVADCRKHGMDLHEVITLITEQWA